MEGYFFGLIGCWNGEVYLVGFWDVVVVLMMCCLMFEKYGICVLILDELWSFDEFNVVLVVI